MTSPQTDSRSSATMYTYTGGAFDLLNPRVEDINIKDVIHHLATTNRWAGAAQLPITVAQHSVIVGDQLPPELRVYGYLHDAKETYVQDRIWPVKKAFAAIGVETKIREEIEDPIDAAIHERFGLTWPLSEHEERLIKQADLIAAATERRDLLTQTRPEEHGIRFDVSPMSKVIKAWGWAKAEEVLTERLELYLPEAFS